MIKLVLVGGGGHCKSCIEVIESDGRFQIIGIVDKAKNKDNTLLGIPFIGTDLDLEEILSENHMAIVTVGQIKTAEIRKKLFYSIKKLGKPMATIVASSSVVSRYSKIKQGSIIMHGAIINAGVDIGNNVIINSSALIEHDVKIGDHCHISTGALINGSSKIEDGCFIGSGAIIHQNIKIGRNAIISAGSVISRDVPEGIKI
jgi:sugar O-acyltransferase (sialic acid O-acetyltransferase NeuD family)